MQFRRATLDEIYRLRFAVLRPGHPVERVHWAGDDLEPPATYHFAAIGSEGQAQTIGCLTLLSSNWGDGPAYQLRGMAVAEGFRSRGIGGELLKLAEQTVRTETPLRLLWCNARVPAVRFYERNGWRVVSEGFDIAGVGPHRKMIRVL